MIIGWDAFRYIFFPLVGGNGAQNIETLLLPGLHCTQLFWGCEDELWKEGILLLMRVIDCTFSDKGKEGCIVNMTKEQVTLLQKTTEESNMTLSLFLLSVCPSACDASLHIPMFSCVFSPNCSYTQIHQGILNSGASSFVPKTMKRLGYPSRPEKHSAPHGGGSSLSLPALLGQSLQALADAVPSPQ